MFGQIKTNKLGNNRIILVGFSQVSFSVLCQWCFKFLVSYLPGFDFPFHACLVSANSIKTLRLTT